MAAYCTADQVRELFARINQNQAFSSSAFPNAGQVTDIIAGVGAEVDMHLQSVGYSIPITTPANFVTYLAALNSWGAAAIVLKSFAPESIVSTNGGPVIPAYSFYEKLYQDALNDIDSRTVVDQSAAMGFNIFARSYLTDNPDNSGVDGNDGMTGGAWGVGQQPVFGMSQVF